MATGWPMSIRELYQEGVVELGPGFDAVCGWPDCKREPLWDVVNEDLLTAKSVATSLTGNEIKSVDENLPDSELVAMQSHNYYSNEHARQFCLESNLELPTKLAA